MSNYVRFLAAVSVFAFLASVRPVLARVEVVVVTGAPGEAEYGAQFAEWARFWQEAAKSAGANVALIGPGDKDRELIEKHLAGANKGGDDLLWLVFIGHGTFDGEQAKFNLRNADLSARDLKAWLAPFTRPIAVIDLSAASAPFVSNLSQPRRAVITATRSGSERNFAHFGRFFSKAIHSSAADLDKDGQTSLLEAFVFASRQMTDFYESEKRVATEHPLLDDNGDGRGTPASAFSRLDLLTGGRDSKADGVVAREWALAAGAKSLSPEAQRQRDGLEREVTALRQQKSKLNETEYYRRLEALLLALARLDPTNAAKP